MIYDLIDRNFDEVKQTDFFTEFFEHFEVLESENSRYITNPEKGIELVVSTNNVITSIHLYSGEKGTCSRYSGPLPNGLYFHFGKAEVHSVLGLPNKFGGGSRNIFLGSINFWERYLFDNYSLHLEYSPDETKIILITCASLRLEKYLDSSLQ